jgi:cobalt-zinc-cadmium efflux system outer membrane protein
VNKTKRIGGNLALVTALGMYFAAACNAQRILTLDDAVREGLQSRASLKAENERIAIARGLQRQAALRPNPEFLFQNENLRPGQTYSRDVDTVAYLTQPVDLAGKRKQRAVVAGQATTRTMAEYDLAKVQIVNAIRLAYWNARGAQEIRDVLQTSVENFKNVLDYHAARLSAGAISEQDFLRVRLENERLKITANVSAIEASRALMDLLKEMSQTSASPVVLAEPLEAVDFTPATLDHVLAQRAEIVVARADLEESIARERLEAINARSDLSVFAGYKRTQLPDTASGVNTVIAGLQVTVPVSNRNQGNREAAAAEVRRSRQLLAAAETAVRAEYESALQEFRMRRDQATSNLDPLRRQAVELAQIANAAYAEGGTDLLRLLDAQRARIDADLAWARGMTEYRQSIARLQAAEGAGSQ